MIVELLELISYNVEGKKEIENDLDILRILWEGLKGCPVCIGHGDPGRESRWNQLEWEKLNSWLKFRNVQKALGIGLFNVWKGSKLARDRDFVGFGKNIVLKLWKGWAHKQKIEWKQVKVRTLDIKELVYNFESSFL